MPWNRCFKSKQLIRWVRKNVNDKFIHQCSVMPSLCGDYWWLNLVDVLEIFYANFCLALRIFQYFAQSLQVHAKNIHIVQAGKKYARHFLSICYLKKRETHSKHWQTSLCSRTITAVVNRNKSKTWAHSQTIANYGQKRKWCSDFILLTFVHLSRLLYGLSICVGLRIRRPVNALSQKKKLVFGYVTLSITICSRYKRIPSY